MSKKFRIGNLEVPYRTEHRDVKYPRIEVKPDGDVLIVLPPDVSNAEEILRNNAEWVYGKISTIERMMEKLDVGGGELEEKLILWGNAYDLELEDGEYDVRIEDATVRVTTPRDVDGLTHFKNWVREELRGILTDFSHLLSNRLGVDYDKLFVRSQKTKWASCSSKSNLSFNLRAAILPEELIRHLVLHELAHLRIDKHDKYFWKIVGTIQPDYKEMEKSLVGYWFLVHRNRLWNEIISR